MVKHDIYDEKIVKKRPMLNGLENAEPDFVNQLKIATEIRF